MRRKSMDIRRTAGNGGAAMFRCHRPALLAVFGVLLLAAAALGAPLRTVREVKALTREEAGQHPPVVLEGVVTYAEPNTFLTFLSDQTGGIYLGTQLSRNCNPGDRIRVTGVASVGNGSNIVTGEAQAMPRIERLGREPLPEARKVNADELSDAALDAEWISVSGTVLSVARINDRASLQLRTGARNFEILVCGFANDRELPYYLTGVPISVRGVLGTFANEPGALSRTVLYVPMLEECTPDPGYLNAQFRERPFTYPELFKNPDHAENRRVHLLGQVTFVRKDRGFFLRVKEQGWFTGNLWVETGQPLHFGAGVMVDVVGRLDMTNGMPVLRDSLVRSIGRAELPMPDALHPNGTIPDMYQGALVTVEGTLIEQQTTYEEDSLIFAAGSVTLFARLDTTSGVGHLPVMEKGSVVKIIGVCVARPKEASGRDANPLGAQIWLRGPDDVAILARPPWWTMRRVLIALGAVAVLTVLAFFWVIALRRQVQAQTERIRKHLSEQMVQEERVRIARDFHDTLEQHLVGLGLTIQAAEAETEDPERIRDLLREAAEMARHTRQEARHAIWELRTGAIPSLGVATLIEQELSPIAQAARVNFIVKTDGAPHSLPVIIQNHLLRIAQEGFTNALKHAKPERIDIRLSYSLEEVRLSIFDDGAGFDTERVVRKDFGAFGLAGMRERAVRMKGTFDIISSPGQGTRLQIRVPLTACDL